MIGITVETDFGSVIKLPVKYPKDDPQNNSNDKIKQLMKNCPAVFAISIMK